MLCGRGVFLDPPCLTDGVLCMLPEQVGSEGLYGTNASRQTLTPTHLHAYAQPHRCGALRNNTQTLLGRQGMES